MSRGRTPKKGVFTGTQFMNLEGVANQCRHKLLKKRWRGISMTAEEVMSLFIEEKHHSLCMEAAQLAKPRGTHFLMLGTTGKYGDFSHKMTLTVRMSEPKFMVPDYANFQSRQTPSGYSKQLLPHLQRYVDGRLSLAIEFGLLQAMLNWFADERLYIPQMAYLFPPIIQMLSQSEVTKQLAEKHSSARSAMPNYVPPPPGLREAFSVVEATLMKALMMYDEEVLEMVHEIGVDVGFPQNHINFMGWEINLR